MFPPIEQPASRKLFNPTKNPTMISKLSLQNFKGCTASYEFGAGNFICGRNFSGKSSIAEGIRAAVLGYIPGQTKTTAAIKAFASDYPCAVAMTADDKDLGITFERVKSTIKQTTDNYLAMQEGGIDDQTRVLFDPDVFFGLSDAARISKACELVQSEGGNRDAIMDAVGSEIGIKDSYETQVIPLGSAYAKWLGEAMKSATINDLLAEADVYWKAQKKEAMAEKDRMQKTMDGTADLATIEQELTKLPTVAEAAVIHKGKNDVYLAARDAENAAKHKNEENARMRKALEADKAEAARIESRKKAVADAEKLVADLAAKIAAATERGTKAKADLEAVKKTAPTAATVRKLSPWVDGAPPVGTGAKYLLEGEGQYSDEFDHIVLSKIIRHQEILPPVPAEEVEALNTAQYEYANELEVATEELAKATSEYKVLEKARQDAVEIERTTRIDLTTSTLAAKRVEEGSAQRADVSAEELNELANATEQAKADAEAANEVQLKVAAMAQDQKRVKDAADRRTELEAKIKTIGKVIELLAQKKVELVSGSIDAPLEIANKLGAGILRGNLVFQEGEIGMQVGEKFWSQRTFSGTENAIVMMGLTAGLANKASLRVLILDEIGKLDAKNALELVDNLAGMVIDGDIDQWFIIGPDNEQLAKSPVFKSGEAQIINVGAVAA